MKSWTYLHFIRVSLDPNPALQSVCISTQLDVISKFAKCALDYIFQIMHCDDYNVYKYYNCNDYN